MTTRDHAPLPPSSAAIWRHCPAFKLANERNPQPDSAATLEGTLAHEVGATLLIGSICDAPGVTDEMLDGADLLNRAVAEMFAPHFPLNIESKLPAGNLFGADVWGTPDVWQYDAKAKVLRVLDYKFGHDFVPEIENDQLAVYTALAVKVQADLYSTSADDLLAGCRVEHIIVQPRCYTAAPVRRWSVPGATLESQLRDLRRAALAADETPTLAKSGDHCKHCPGRHECPAISAAAGHCIDVSDQGFPLVATVAQKSARLAELERAAQRIESERSGLSAHLLALAQSGTAVPGWQVGHGRPRRIWTCDKEEAAAVGDMVGVNVRKPAVLTPQQAIDKGVALSVVEAYSKVSTGEARLIRDDGTAAARAFSQESQA